VIVETADHAKLLLKLTYSWVFNFDRKNQEHLEKLFQVKDFIGDSCKTIASRIRGIVSATSFDCFHKESSSIVQLGVFGKDSEGKLKIPLPFRNNNLFITNVDIQSQEPVDKKTREILNDSMKLAMSTNIKIQEAEARHREERAEQESKGRVERKRIEDETESEEQRLVLLKLSANNQSIIITGEAESIAKAEVEENEIRSKADLEKSRNNNEIEKIKRTAELENKQKLFKEEVIHLRKMSNLKIDIVNKQAENEIKKNRKDGLGNWKRNSCGIIKGWPRVSGKNSFWFRSEIYSYN